MAVMRREIVARHGGHALLVAGAGEGNAIGVRLAVKQRRQFAQRQTRWLGLFRADLRQHLAAHPLHLSRREGGVADNVGEQRERSEEHTSELQSLMRISYAVFCLKKKKIRINNTDVEQQTIKQPVKS